MSYLGEQIWESEMPTARARVRRSWAWTRLLTAFVLLEWALWSVQTQRIASLAFIAWVITTTVVERRKLHEVGLGVRGFGGSLIALFVSVAAAVVILWGAWMLGTLRPIGGSKPLLHAFGYLAWSTVQEFILNSYFFLTFEELLPPGPLPILLAGALFTVAHIPNPVLMVGTFVASMFFVTVFRRYRNVYPLGISHAMLGLTLTLAIPDAYLRHMRVGIGYLHFVLK